MSKEIQKLHDLKIDAIIHELNEAQMCCIQVENYLKGTKLHEKAKDVWFIVRQFQNEFINEKDKRKKT
jgi:hypothetical protein